MALIGVVGSRELPSAWASRVAQVVGSLAARGHSVASGGARGADLFALQAVVSHGLCKGSVVFLPGVVSQSPWACRGSLQAFEQGGGSIVPGSASPSASRDEFVRALFVRSQALVAACQGVVAFLSGKASGTWFTCQAAARLGRSVVVFPADGARSLRSLGCGSWRPLQAWAGAYQWVPSVPAGSRCKHGILVQHCSGLRPAQRIEE